ncbi:MAG: cardiolipin synthase [Planctomycetota bacterium]
MSYLQWILLEAMVVLGFVSALVLIPRIIMERRQAGATLAWLLIVVLMPYIGVPLFLLIGGRRVERVRESKRRPRLEPEERSAASFRDEVSESAWDIASLMLRYGGSPPRRGNSLQIITDGQEVYDSILEAIDGAQDHVEVCTYILGRDRTGDGITDKLTEKARQGVDVRLLTDSVGSMWARRTSLWSLRRAGGRTGSFLPMLTFRRRAAAHLRNHRKIVVVDDRVAFVGGMNMSCEYMGPPLARRRWRDIMVRLEGPPAADLHYVFDADWEFTTSESPREASYRDPPASGGATVQIVPDGPDVPENPIASGVTTAVARARERVWIVSPFYVPDEWFANSLETAARMGCDVRLVVPQRTNIRTADLAGRSYLDSLMAAGARVFRYEKGFLHAKLLVVDDTLAGVGSFNLDVRSFHLNFEIGAFLYDRDSIRSIADTITDIQDDARQLDPEQFGSRGGLVRFTEDTCRLLSPLL